MNLMQANNANIFFVVCLYVYALLFSLYYEFLYDVLPYGTEIIHISPLFTWLVCLFLTSPFGHDLERVMSCRHRVKQVLQQVAKAKAPAPVPILRRSLLILGIVAQSVCLVFDGLSLCFFFTCEGNDCPSTGARVFGGGVVGLMVLNIVIIFTAAVKFRHSYNIDEHKRTWMSEELKDRLLPVRACAHLTRLGFSIALLVDAFNPLSASLLEKIFACGISASLLEKIFACAISLIDVVWLGMAAKVQYDHNKWKTFLKTNFPNVCKNAEERLEKLKYWLTPDDKTNLTRFRLITFANFTVNSAALLALLLKNWLAPTTVVHALQILTIGIIFFTAHDRFELAVAFEGLDCSKLPANTDSVTTKMRPMRVESSYTMRSRQFKLKF